MTTKAQRDFMKNSYESVYIGGYECISVANLAEELDELDESLATSRSLTVQTMKALKSMGERAAKAEAKLAIYYRMRP